IGELGDDGVDGVVEALATPGATLDCAGQLYGWWVMATATSDFLALPQSIERIDLFRALPQGRRYATRVRITGFDDRTVRADLELIDDDGCVAVRITGWVDRRFDSDPPLWDMLRDPETHLLGTVAPAGFVVVDERWKDSASRELIARRYLNGGERATYDGLNPRAQRHWLLGRIAAKDAVRHALWSEGHGPVFPAEITIGNNPDGAPEVVAGPGRGRPLTISHTSWAGAARCGPVGGEGLGIDIDTIAPRSPGLAAVALTPAEEALLPALDDEWLTRAWAAKEAAGKAIGRGIAGRPRDLQIRDVDGQRLLVGDRWVGTARVTAPVQRTWGGPGEPPDTEAEREDHVVAWTEHTDRTP
ncbi:MAG: 4'-phosphopantetheinyl transferase superfamily protein, partial [Acidimicrobiales bacterium]|nr:4'-phosphopantetheinyl transferase superfamily protein [Acidimicrobiales bacterium]